MATHDAGVLETQNDHNVYVTFEILKLFFTPSLKQRGWIVEPNSLERSRSALDQQIIAGRQSSVSLSFEGLKSMMSKTASMTTGIKLRNIG